MENSELEYLAFILVFLFMVALGLLAFEKAPESLQWLVALIALAILAAAFFGTRFLIYRGGIEISR